MPDNDVTATLTAPGDIVFAGTARGLARWRDDRWQAVVHRQEPVRAIALHGSNLLVAFANELIEYAPMTDSVSTLAKMPPAAASGGVISMASACQDIYLGAGNGMLVLKDGELVPVADFNELVTDNPAVRQLASSADGEIAVAAAEGLFTKTLEGPWQAIRPRQGKRSWNPHDVRGVAYDAEGRLWFASAQGVGCRKNDQWQLYTGAEGLPYDDFTTCSAGDEGVVWFGTTMGAIRFDGGAWSYRQGRRWVPDDRIRSIAVQSNGNAWLATANGVGLIERRQITLAEKAAFFEEEIDRYHRRTPFGLVNWVSAAKPDDKLSTEQHDSDNDGLWTSMYGAGECFAYGATKDPQAKQRATAAFEAVKFLSEVTQGGSHPAPRGFPARSILPTSGSDPNKRDSPERDRAMQQRDPHWKLISPRWPVSADGKWYWKADASSDELDGHYFLYAAYYDLVAESPEEKARVRQVVHDITSHLIDHNYQLVDHDGQPTRWARFNSEVLDHGHLIDGRGLNSLSILSYLKTAEHITGDPKFREHYHMLVKKHSYAANSFTPKWSLGYGTGNQSDDEMAFMCYYNLLRYETDSELLKLYHRSLSWYWALERPERNPLFNFIFAAVWKGNDGFPVRSVPQSALDDAVDSLKRLPLDRFDWAHKNSHRLDVVPLKNRWFRNAGSRVDGHAIPVDERHFEHWNHNPWRLDVGGDGHVLADGTTYLLPYYVGRYHGFIKE